MRSDKTCSTTSSENHSESLESCRLCSIDKRHVSLVDIHQGHVDSQCRENQLSYNSTDWNTNQVSNQLHSSQDSSHIETAENIHDRIYDRNTSPIETASLSHAKNTTNVATSSLNDASLQNGNILDSQITTTRERDDQMQGEMGLALLKRQDFLILVIPLILTGAMAMMLKHMILIHLKMYNLEHSTARILAFVWGMETLYRFVLAAYLDFFRRKIILVMIANVCICLIYTMINFITGIRAALVGITMIGNLAVAILGTSVPVIIVEAFGPKYFAINYGCIYFLMAVVAVTSQELMGLTYNLTIKLAGITFCSGFDCFQICFIVFTVISLICCLINLCHVMLYEINGDIVEDKDLTASNNRNIEVESEATESTETLSEGHKAIWEENDYLDKVRLLLWRGTLSLENLHKGSSNLCHASQTTHVTQLQTTAV